jgi:hypothetical protein
MLRVCTPGTPPGTQILNLKHERQNMQNAQLVLLIPVGGADLPGFGGGIGAQPGHPSTGPVYPPGHPSAGLPIQPGHPSHGLPPGGVVAPPINLPPNVIWPPQFPPSAGQLPVPPSDVIGSNPPAAPAHPIAPGEPLPAGQAFVAVYTTDKGWRSTIIKAPPSGAQPK